MFNLKKTLYQALVGVSACSVPLSITAQTLNLSDLSAFKNPSASWVIVGKAGADPNRNAFIETQPGTGILANVPGKVAKDQARDLFSNLEHGDAVIEFDFMMPSGSNSGFYLQSRYEIQLLDSWGKKLPNYGDCGGIYERWNDSKPDGQKGYEGYPPRLNASRAPGIWQNMKITFRAPRFNGQGIKTENAKIINITLNGSTLHEDVELTGPTRGAVSEKEVAKAPFRIQGDHGPVAFRNLSVKSVDLSKPQTQNRGNNSRSPIFLNASSETIIHRSFINYPGKRLPYGASVGDLSKVNYSVDLNSGAIIRVWRGDFLDVTPMWNDRGNGTSNPLGSAVNLGTDNIISQVAGAKSDNYLFKGYDVDSENKPTFLYQYNNVLFRDDIRPDTFGKYIVRTIQPTSAITSFTVKLAEGKEIETKTDGGFLIDGAYYIKVNVGEKPVVLDLGDGKKALSVSGKEKLSYSIIW